MNTGILSEVILRFPDAWELVADARLGFERLGVDQEVRHLWHLVVLSVLRIRVRGYEFSLRETTKCGVAQVLR